MHSETFFLPDHAVDQGAASKHAATPRVGHSGRRKGQKSRDEAALSAIGLGESVHALPETLLEGSSLAHQAVNPLARLKPNGRAANSVNVASGNKLKVNAKDKTQQPSQQTTPLRGARKQEGSGGGGRPKVKGAAAFLQQQRLGGQKAQSMLGNDTMNGVNGSAKDRFSNRVPPSESSSQPGNQLPSGRAALASGGRHGSSPNGKSGGNSMDMATYQRFSDLGQRLANARTNLEQSQQRPGKRQQAWQPSSKPRLQASSAPSSPPPSNHEHPQYRQEGFAGFALANGESVGKGKVSGNRLDRGRWGAPATAAAAPAAVSPIGAEHARLWEVDLGERKSASARASVLSREESHENQKIRSQELQHRQRRRQGRKGPRLGRRLRALQRVPLVLPHEPIPVRELAQKLSLKMKDVGERVLRLGGPEEYYNWTPETKVDLDVAELVGLELGRTVKRMAPPENLLEYRSRVREGRGGRRVEWPLRPPVVCVMGHVDHGKTTLLDALRQSEVAAAEAGGITQRLGAFHIPGVGEGGEEGGLGITVLDTPGHAAFKAMRMHGALATDIVLLVVSATDGLQEQTLEVLRMLEEQWAEEEEDFRMQRGGEGGKMEVFSPSLSLMVAVTKVDKLHGEEEMQAALSKIEHALAAHGIMSEALGGDVQVVPVSAVTGAGLPDLLDRVRLQAEMLELRADREGPGEGVILDAGMERGFGMVMSVLMRWGSLVQGDVVVAGEQWGRVKKILGARNSPGKDGEGGGAVDRALPSMPVRVLGLRDLPTPGQEVIVVKSEERAEAVAKARREAAERRRYQETAATEVLGEEEQEQLQEILDKNLVGANVGGKKTKAYLALQRGAVDDLLDSASAKREGGQEGRGRQGPIIVPFLVKADGKGTLDAVTAALAAYEHDTIRTEVIGTGCGPVTEGDVEKAKGVAARECDGGGEACTILAFNVGFVNAEVGEMARREGVSVKKEDVIYTLLEQTKATLQEHMPWERVETSVGKMEVQAMFTLTGKRRARNTVAGCKVVSGGVFSGQQYRYRVMRGGEAVCKESPPATLYHFKEQVQEVKKGQECGLALEGFGAFEAGDVIECYTVTEKQRSIAEVFPY